MSAADDDLGGVRVVDRGARGSAAGTLFGAIVGGVIGHQFGSGRGNDAATVAGTLIGAAIGTEARRERGHDVEVEQPGGTDANLFEKLRSQEDRAMRRMIRHAQGLADL